MLDVGLSKFHRSEILGDLGSVVALCYAGNSDLPAVEELWWAGGIHY
jgi:hypothetical protein